MPEAIFHYVYAVLYAPAYRMKYAEFLKMDFPRIPFTSDAKLFKKLAALGEKLVALHLLNSPDLNPPACRFEGDGNNRVEKTGLRYAAGSISILHSTSHPCLKLSGLIKSVAIRSARSGSRIARSGVSNSMTSPPAAAS